MAQLEKTAQDAAAYSQETASTAVSLNSQAAELERCVPALTTWSTASATSQKLAAECG